MWYVYLIECKTGALYCGVTKDLKKRFCQHEIGVGSKYVRSQGGPLRFVFYRKLGSRVEAYKEEWRIKKLKRSQKFELINSSLNEAHEDQKA